MAYSGWCYINRWSLETLIDPSPSFLNLRWRNWGPGRPAGRFSWPFHQCSLHISLMPKVSNSRKKWEIQAWKVSSEALCQRGQTEMFPLFLKREMNQDPFRIQGTSKACLPVRTSLQSPVPFMRAAEHHTGSGKANKGPRTLATTGLGVDHGEAWTPTFTQQYELSLPSPLGWHQRSSGTSRLPT